MSDSSEATEAAEGTSPVGHLARLFLHPVKSARRVEVTEAAVTQYGLAGDRMYQVIDGDGAPVTQRSNRKLALLEVGYGNGSDAVGPAGLPTSELWLSVPDVGTVTVQRPEANDTVTSVLTGEHVEAGDAGDDAAQLLSDLLGEPVRLVAFTGSSQRPSQLFRGREVTFVDAAPALVNSQTSLEHLEQLAGTTFGVERFRPNLVVDGAPPWEEDTWKQFTVGEASFSVRAPWPRCAVPQIDQDTAERHREPAVVLREHRWCDDASSAYPNRPGMRGFLEGNALFGVACSAEPVGAVLRVGDPVHVSETGPPVLAPPS